MVARGTTHAAMEVSSHALDQDRTAGVAFDAVIVTNITHDHFDYHKNVAGYRASKARLLEHLKPHGLVVLNSDDPESSALSARIRPDARLTTYGLSRPARIRGAVLDESLAGTRFVLQRAAESIEISTRLIGRHNVSNCLAAAAVAERFECPLEAVKAGIETLNGVPGRLERVECGQSFDVFVDYAHTHDALRRGIETLKRLSRGRVICVVGAGGDRDRLKRPLIGRVVAEADLAVLTSDNPRSEEPQSIVQQIFAGYDPAANPPIVELDRAQAIRRALEAAEPGDCVLIAGKGHEREQIIGSRRIPFVDRDVAREALAGLRDRAPAAPVGA
jgi:UDP-N-acetylmuramoyl-L-alanyl-D-glutamate--2,6-diaminopimelate ligase